MEPERNVRKILIIDDDESVLRILKRIMDKIQRECTLVANAEEARILMEEELFDLVLCDIRLPGESGIDLIKHIITQYPETAVIMVSGLEDPQIAETALEIGAYGYILKPFKPSEVIINVSSALRRQKLEAESRLYREHLEQMVAARTAKLEETLDGIVQVVAQTVESRDPYTAGHQRRVADFACAIAKEMEFSTDQIKGIRMAGIIHDLGKISVPSEILSKPGRLNDNEFALIKGHPQVGYDILKGIEFRWPIAQMIYQHHEREDGSGYPQKLKAENILMEAKILAVADVVEAMSSHRPYRPALGMDVAMGEILKNRGCLYDPAVVDACKTVVQDKKFVFEKQA